MKFHSPDFGDYGPMPERLTGDGENHSPSFIIDEVPTGTKKLVLICHDPDAPGGDWVHWVVWGLNPKTAIIESGGLPKGATVGKTSFGHRQYGGPEPPIGSGPHRYIFSLYAVDSSVDIPADATRDEILKLIAGRLAAQSTWTGIYERKTAES